MLSKENMSETTTSDGTQRTSTANARISMIGAKVLLRYGPYESCGVVCHREERLEGMQNVLKKAGYVVSLQRFNDWNSVELWVRGEKVFKCDIRELDFGSDGFLDKLCSEAVMKVNRAYA